MCEKSGPATCGQRDTKRTSQQSDKIEIEMDPKLLFKVCAGSAAIGAGMELFMIKTGFYEIVTRKEAERRQERAQEETALRQRLAGLKIDFDTEEKK